MMNQWLEDRCWSNYPLIKGDICAVALNFNGLGGGVCTQWYPLELGLAEKNILTVTPYYGPWSWMNRQSRMFVDELVGRVYSVLQLAEDIHQGIDQTHIRDVSSWGHTWVSNMLFLFLKTELFSRKGYLPNYIMPGPILVHHIH